MSKSSKKPSTQLLVGNKFIGNETDSIPILPTDSLSDIEESAVGPRVTKKSNPHPTPIASHENIPIFKNNLDMAARRAGTLPLFNPHFDTHGAEILKPRGEPKKTSRDGKRKSNSYPTTTGPTSLAADYAFPNGRTISHFIENLKQMKWSSLSLIPPEESNSEIEYHDVYTPSHPGTKSNSSVILHPRNRKSGRETSVDPFAPVYNLVSKSLECLSGIIGTESDLAPREDTVCYNGYKIKVAGRMLLLECVHFNRDFDINNGLNRIWSRNFQSYVNLQAQEKQKRAAEEQSYWDQCESRNRKRVRIVIRITGSTAYQPEKVPPSFESGLQHRVLVKDGKWTFFLNEKENRSIISGDGEGCKKKAKEDSKNKNFVEIVCPTGVCSKYIEYSFVNELLCIDAP